MYSLGIPQQNKKSTLDDKTAKYPLASSFCMHVVWADDLPPYNMAKQHLLTDIIISYDLYKLHFGCAVFCLLKSCLMLQSWPLWGVNEPYYEYEVWMNQTMSHKTISLALWV